MDFGFARHLLGVAFVANDLLSISLGFLDFLLPGSDDSWVFLSGVRLQILARLYDYLAEWVVILVVVVQFVAWRFVVIKIDFVDGAMSFLILDNVVSLAA